MSNIHFDIIRATEAAAIAASMEVGRGDKNAADYAATCAMRDRLNKIDFAGKVVIGEGQKDEAPCFDIGEPVGALWRDGDDEEMPYYDLAIDPIEGTTPTSKGGYEAMSVIAAGSKNSLFSSTQYYMNKLAVGPQVCSKVELNIGDSLSRTIKLVSLALSKESSKLTVCMLDRPRHADTIAYLRRLGCRIKLIQDCDVSAAIATALPESGIDIYLGTGGAPEGVISAVALKCMRGEFQGQLADKDGNLLDNKVYHMGDLAKGDVIFGCTGITDGSLLKGVRYTSYGRSETHSLLMRSSSGTVRWIKAEHGN